jgi:hypothetical protein
LADDLRLKLNFFMLLLYFFYQFLNNLICDMVYVCSSSRSTDTVDEAHTVEFSIRNGGYDIPPLVVGCVLNKWALSVSAFILLKVHFAVVDKVLNRDHLVVISNRNFSVNDCCKVINTLFKEP